MQSTNSLGGNGHDIWSDFTVGHTSLNNNADKINISNLLVDYNKDSSLVNIEKFLTVHNTNQDTLIYIDRDGSESKYQDTLLLTLENVSTTLEELLNNNQLIMG